MRTHCWASRLPPCMAKNQIMAVFVSGVSLKYFRRLFTISVLSYQVGSICCKEMSFGPLKSSSAPYFSNKSATASQSLLVAGRSDMAYSTFGWGSLLVIAFFFQVLAYLTAPMFVSSTLEGIKHLSKSSYFSSFSWN